MKLVLMSAFNNDTISKKIVELVGKPLEEISVAILNECSQVEGWDVRYLLMTFAGLNETYGGGMYLCDLRNESLEENEKRIAKADIIFCCGGHVDYLQTVFDKSGFTKILPELLKTKVWVGSSAGSCVMGVRPPNEFRLDVDKVRLENVTKYQELVKLSIRPHVWADHSQSEGVDVSIKESENNGGIPVYALSDDAAIIVTGEKIYIAGTKGQKFIHGKLVEEI